MGLCFPHLYVFTIFVFVCVFFLYFLLLLIPSMLFFSARMNVKLERTSIILLYHFYQRKESKERLVLTLDCQHLSLPPSSKRETKNRVRERESKILNGPI